MLNSHAKQILGNVEGMTGYTVLAMFLRCHDRPTVLSSPEPKITGIQVWSSCRPDMMKMATDDIIFRKILPKHIFNASGSAWGSSILHGNCSVKETEMLAVTQQCYSLAAMYNAFQVRSKSPDPSPRR